jgi:hypothetical protein
MRRRDAACAFGLDRQELYFTNTVTGLIWLKIAQRFNAGKKATRSEVSPGRDDRINISKTT